MNISLENLNSNKSLIEVSDFINKLEKLSTKKEVASMGLSYFGKILDSGFSSYVERENDLLKVICQMGDDNLVKDIFSNKMCNEIFDCVITQNDVTSIKISQRGQFIFVPLKDFYRKTQHGMFVFQILKSDFNLHKNMSTALNTLAKITGVYMTKILKENESVKYEKLDEQVKSELKLVTKLQKAMSGSEESKKILFSVLEDEGSGFNGNVWWVSELGADICLVLIAQVLCKGSPSAMLSGYLLGEMNSLKSRAEISLKPQEVLKYLNQELNSIFKSTGITVNAWYGVFNLEGRKVRFANANHPDPFLIGPEQQISNLFSDVNQKGKPLGVNIDSVYTETSSNISSGSKLIICTKDLLEQAAQVGDRYDPSWFPQILETIGALSLPEMRKSLENILSENSEGTAKKAPRLALLLEIPS